jgi:peptidoglycan hydrolase-like protein with peptidoglycan-binding domain
MTFDTSQHPRAAAGSAAGGQFVSYDADKKHGTGYGHKNGDPRVKRLQEALNKLGFTDSKSRRLEVDGKLGPLTTQAVKAAQKKLGVKEDGRVDPALLKRLAELSKHDLASIGMDSLLRSAAKKTAAKRTAKTTTVATVPPGRSASAARKRAK